MAWKNYTGKIQNGILVEGDKTVPRTHWWNHLWLLWFRWTTHAVFVNVSFAPCRVGYRDWRGKTKLNTEYTDYDFRVRIGHEDCTFFGINAKGEEVALVFAGKFHKDEPQIANATLV